MTWIRSAIFRTRGLAMTTPALGTASSAEGAEPALLGVSTPREVPVRLHHMMKQGRNGSAPRDLLHLEGLDDVALLDVLVVPQDQTTLEALADLGRVVLLALQRSQVEVVRHDGAVADQPYLGVAPDHAAGDHAARDVADLRRAEDRTDLRLAEGRLLELGLEHALEAASISSIAL